MLGPFMAGPSEPTLARSEGSTGERGVGAGHHEGDRTGRSEGAWGVLRSVVWKMLCDGPLYHGARRVVLPGRRTGNDAPCDPNAPPDGLIGGAFGVDGKNHPFGRSRPTAARVEAFEARSSARVRGLERPGGSYGRANLVGAVEAQGASTRGWVARGAEVRPGPVAGGCGSGRGRFRGFGARAAAPGDRQTPAVGEGGRS